ncbi:hypothetical protein HCJ39_07100 [Listeria rocourtiae]|uniref:hypothetical protein n=1 Tax=Listeria rocourtiae TaxID=647910 RepID=UPI00162AEB77|nr:hypothetical protein [Listeria rocourtiae]MBC1604477.1 hypothetical protein [Listeria rocourtiae]
MKFNVKEKEENLHKVDVKTSLEEETIRYEEEAPKKKTFLFWGKRKKQEETGDYVSLDQEMANVAKVRKVRKKKIKIPRKTTEVSPLLGWGGTPEQSFVRYKAGYFEILQIRGYNLFGMSVDDVYRLIDSFTNFSRLYVKPFKIMLMHFPVPTSRQQDYYKKVIQRTKVVNHQKILQRKLAEHQHIANHRYNKEFFLVLYAPTVDQLQEEIMSIEQFSGYLEINPIKRQKKTQMIYKLNNMNARILVND